MTSFKEFCKGVLLLVISGILALFTYAAFGYAVGWWGR